MRRASFCHHILGKYTQRLWPQGWRRTESQLNEAPRDLGEWGALSAFYSFQVSLGLYTVKRSTNPGLPGRNESSFVKVCLKIVAPAASDRGILEECKGYVAGHPTLTTTWRARGRHWRGALATPRLIKNNNSHKIK